MAKEYYTNGTGSEQTVHESPTEKIPVYSTEADLDTDLANLADGELALYPSEGAEMSLPVDVVQSGNLHAVTSNAVEKAISPDYANAVTKLSDVGNFIVEDDGWIDCVLLGYTTGGDSSMAVDIYASADAITPIRVAYVYTTSGAVSTATLAKVSKGNKVVMSKDNAFVAVQPRVIFIPHK